MIAFVGLGANLGDRLLSLRQGVAALSQLGQVRARSRIYESTYQAAQGGEAGPAQPDYLNAAVMLDTKLSPREVLDHLLRIEASQGRVREPGKREEPRTLDLDLLLLGQHGEQVLRLPPEMIVPLPRLHQRAFVLLPLLDLDPGLRHPVLGVPLRELLLDGAHAQPSPLGLELL